MKRLCVFYRKARDWQYKPVEWIVCKKCQKHIKDGDLHQLIVRAYKDYHCVDPITLPVQQDKTV
jgi:hypothetical protein